MSDILTSVVIAAIISSTFSAVISYIFTTRASKKRQINESIAKLVAACRKYRDSYIRMVEYDIDFANQQKLAAEAHRQGKEKIFDVHIQSANFSQQTGLEYQRNLSDASSSLAESGFILAGLANKEFSKHKIQDSMNKVFGYKLENRSEFEQATVEIDKALLPHLSKIETACNRLLWKNNTAGIVRFYQYLNDMRKRDGKKVKS